jgi:phage shock protein E
MGKRVFIVRIILFALLAIYIIFRFIDGRNSAQNENKIEEQKAMYKKISAEEAKHVIDTESNIIILDVRTQEEYTEGHIANSMLIPVETLESQVEAKIPNKDTKILVYCRSGNRSRTASQMLLDLNYTNVYDFGGIIDWTYGVEK